MKHSLLFFISLLFFTTVYSQKKSEALYSRAKAVYDSGNYVQADSLFSHYLNEYPTIEKCREIATLYMRNNDSCAFCRYLRKSAELNDKRSRTTYDRLCLHFDTTFYDNPKGDSVRYLSVISYDKCNLPMKQIFVKEKNEKDLEYVYHFADTGGVILRHFDQFPLAGDNQGNIEIDYNKYMPEFPGGPEALMNFMQDNIKYPRMAREDKISGRVIVSFIVEKDGSIDDVNVLQSVDRSLDAEAVRVVKAMPKWKPAFVEGKPVRVQFNLPVKFTL